jgi:hypothetical protein
MRVCRLMLLTVGVGVGLWAADVPEAGRWRLNLEKSSVPRPQIMTIVPLSDNSYRVSFDGLSDQYVVTFESEGIHDNSAGSLRFARRIDERHSQQKLNADGKEIGSIDTFVSSDGNLMTCVYRNQNNSIALHVYDKQ